MFVVGCAGVSGVLLVLPEQIAARGQQAAAFEVAPGPVRVLVADRTNSFTYVSAPRQFVAQPKTASVTVTYNGFSAAAQAAFQSAVDIWQTQLTSTVPIQVVANFTPLDLDTLGSAGSNLVYRNFANGVPNVFYAAALANKLAGSDVNPGEHDITANFNSSFTGWYFGTDGKTPINQYDFKSVVLHELGHGLGFFGSMDVTAGMGSYGLGSPSNPTIFDTLAVNASVQSLVNTSLFANPSAALAAQLTGNNVFWNGTAGIAANAGARPKLYAPGNWLAGSSFSHLDETTYPKGNANSLMTYAIGAAEAIHDPGPITRGIFTDIGWTVSASTPGGPSLTLNRTTAQYGAVNSGGTLSAQTAAQTFTLNQTGAGTVNWTAVPSESWLTVTPATGTGTSSFTVAINNTGGVLPASGTRTATVTITAPASSNSPQTLTVTLVVYSSTAVTAAPFGSVDTPVQNATGIAGALGVTGWALDDTEVSQIRIFRAAVGAEPAGQQIFVGFALFVTGARPDVETAYPTLPFNYRGGWGYQLLTNMLPGGGNGVFTLFIYADDREGRTTLLGTRTVTISNSTSTLPFGAIDAPAPGATISGSLFDFYGWALTPNPKQIPTDGSTITVFIDGVSQGTVTYNQPRADIATLFPGYANTNGSLFRKVLNTTTFSNGVHTISVNVFDNAAAGAGIGSRYFGIQNGSAVVAGSMTAAPSSLGSLRALQATHTPDGAGVSSAPIRLVRGFQDEGPAELVSADSRGVRHIVAREQDRVVIHLSGDQPASDGHVAGYLVVGDEMRALPIGSNLDEDREVFSWAPGPGFLGPYDLVFVRTDRGGLREQVRVRVTVRPQHAAPAAKP